MSITDNLKAANDLKNKCKEINVVMLTHLEGACPDYIFKQRRPLESKSEYALEYRQNNFHPVTKAPFDKAVAAVSEIASSCNIVSSNVLDETKKPITVTYNDELVEAYEFCLNRLTRIRELDCNGYIVDYPRPLIEPKYDSNLDNFDTELTCIFVGSDDVQSYKKGVLIANIGMWQWKDGQFEPYRLIISKFQTALSIPVADGNTYKYRDVPVYENNLTIDPVKCVSRNQFVSKKMKYALPYFWGAAAWGNKFYGEMTDFDIKMARFTYPFTIKTKLECQSPGTQMKDGRHWDIANNRLCTTCKGSGWLYAEESPMGVTYVDREKLITDNGNTVPVVSFVEPSQAGILTTERIIDKYYDFMSIELGLMKQNTTNQSGESKSYDEKSRITMFSTIVYDNIGVLEWLLNIRQDYLYNYKTKKIPVISIEIIGELNIKTNDELIAEYNTAINAHPAIKSSLTKKILLKQLGDNQLTRRVIELASEYDKLFMYGANDLVTIRAQLGTIKEKDVIIHNTVVDQILKLLKDVNMTDDQVMAKLDIYYSKYDVINPSMPNILN